MVYQDVQKVLRAPAGRWTLILDEMPPGPNDRLHWAERARRARGYRAWAHFTARQMAIPPCERVRLSAVFTRRVVGRADEDNDRARLKNLCDGLVDAGVIPNDTRGHIEWGACTEAKGHPGVVLVIEALGGGEAG